MSIKSGFRCPADSEWRVELDKEEIFPDDPGQGTPAMVYGPNGISGTLNCCIETGECDGVDIPFLVFVWLEENDDVWNEELFGRPVDTQDSLLDDLVSFIEGFEGDEMQEGFPEKLLKRIKAFRST